MTSKKSLSRVIQLLTIFISIGFLYTFSQILLLYTVFVPAAVIGSILFPLLVFHMYRIFISWLGEGLDDDLFEPFPNRKSYLRSWTLSFEYILVILSVLLIVNLIGEGMFVSTMWILFGMVTFIVFPIRIRKQLSELELSEDMYPVILNRFILGSSIFGSFAFISGAAFILLTFVGRIIS